jgi:hypothetical protein
MPSYRFNGFSTRISAKSSARFEHRLFALGGCNLLGTGQAADGEVYNF